MAALPCPFVVDTCSHGALVVALHWHSRDVVSVTVPVPPFAPMVTFAGPSEIPHRCSDGPSAVVEPDPQAIWTAASRSKAGTLRESTLVTFDDRIEHRPIRRCHATL